jgi:hypothetical protein
MKRLILPIVCVILAACVTTPTAAADPTARLGEVATVEGLSIRPLRVVEDSRCPINARCIWAGRVVLHTEVWSAGGRVTYNLVLGEPVEHGGGRLALVAAEPGRMAGSETEPGAYQFTFEFTPR